jgi:hypothetical protein
MKINMQNYESYCLLYIDNELAAAERMELELFMQAHPTLANELAALQQTVLTPETLLFEDKAILYRYDEMEASLPSSFKQSLYRQEAKVVNRYFTRTSIIRITSIAAMLLLFIGYQFYFSDRININKKEISQNNKGSLKWKDSQDSKDAKDANNLVGGDANNNLENNALAKYKSKIIEAADPNLFTTNNLPALKETNFISQETKTQNNTIEPEIVVSAISSENSSNSDSDPNSAPINDNANNTIKNANIISETPENYNTINTDEHDRTIYIANFEIDSDKLRGVTRRINALFKRNKNDKQK